MVSLLFLTHLLGVIVLQLLLHAIRTFKANVVLVLGQVGLTWIANVANVALFLTHLNESYFLCKIVVDSCLDSSFWGGFPECYHFL